MASAICGTVAKEAKKHRAEFRQELKELAPDGSFPIGEAFDRREPGWIKVELKPSPKEREAA